jgi:hypothetical protein
MGEFFNATRIFIAEIYQATLRYRGAVCPPAWSELQRQCRSDVAAADAFPDLIGAVALCPHPEPAAERVDPNRAVDTESRTSPRRRRQPATPSPLRPPSVAAKA